VFHELAVLDAGRAGGFAGAAVETFVNVIDERIGDGKIAQLDVDHLVDAAARGIRFEIPEAVGGASVETKTAVDAASVVFVKGSRTGNGERGHGYWRRMILREFAAVRLRAEEECD
jgi:hypothetical protein